MDLLEESTGDFDGYFDDEEKALYHAAKRFLSDVKNRLEHIDGKYQDLRKKYRAALENSKATA